MSDLEMTRLCAEAMGVTVHLVAEPEFHYSDCPYYEIPELSESPNEKYKPLHDDAQAMALVKRLALPISPLIDGTQHIGWVVGAITPSNVNQSDNLNRAIVECVAKMRAAKNA